MNPEIEFTHTGITSGPLADRCSAEIVEGVWV